MITPSYLTCMERCKVFPNRRGSSNHGSFLLLVNSKSPVLSGLTDRPSSSHHVLTLWRANFTRHDTQFVNFPNPKKRCHPQILVNKRLLYWALLAIHRQGTIGGVTARLTVARLWTPLRSWKVYQVPLRPGGLPGWPWSIVGWCSLPHASQIGHTWSHMRCCWTLILCLRRLLSLYPAGPEPSKPVPRADEWPFPQTLQSGMHDNWDEAVWGPKFQPLRIYPPASPWS